MVEWHVRARIAESASTGPSGATRGLARLQPSFGVERKLVMMLVALLMFLFFTPCSKKGRNRLGFDGPPLYVARL